MADKQFKAPLEDAKVDDKAHYAGLRKEVEETGKRITETEHRLETLTSIK